MIPTPEPLADYRPVSDEALRDPVVRESDGLAILVVSCATMFVVIVLLAIFGR